MVESNQEPYPRFHTQDTQRNTCHLHSGSTELDDNDIAKLLTKCHIPWDVTKNPGTQCAWDDKIKKATGMQRYYRAIPHPLGIAKAGFKATGTYGLL